MNPVVIREYTPADRAAVVAHLVEFQDHERKSEPLYAPGADIAEPYLDGLEGACLRGEGRILVADVHGMIVGYTAFQCQQPACLTIEREVVVWDLYVTPPWRGYGIGRTLLGRADAYARERGAERLILTTLARNAEGRAMYARCGFREFEVTLVRDVPDGSGGDR